MNIVDEGNIIETYCKRERDAALAYLMIQRGSQIAQESSLISPGLEKRKLHDWLCGKRKPQPIKTIEDLKNRNLLPLYPDDPRLPTIARIVGALFGDGSLMRTSRNCSNLSAAFGSGDHRVIEIFDQDVRQAFGPLNSAVTEYWHESKYGKSIRYELRTSSVCRLLSCLGVPIGDKVSQPIWIPEWVSKGPKEVKIAFLDGILSSELSKAIAQRHSYLPNVLHFSMSKVEKLTETHLSFLNSLRYLLAELGIKTSGVFKRNMRRRRDGLISNEWAFHITNSRENIVKFFNTISLTYAPKRREALLKLMKSDPHIVLKDGRAIYAPKTKLTIYGKYGGTSTVPALVRHLWGVRIYDTLYLEKQEEGTLVISKEASGLARRISKGWIFYIPQKYVAHLHINKEEPSIRWHLERDRAVLRGE